MKSIKYIILFIFICSLSVFGQQNRSVELDFIVPVGASLGINYYTLKSDATNKSTVDRFEEKLSKNSKPPFLGFDTGLYVLVGKRFPMGKNVSFGIFGEFGWSHDSFATAVVSKDQSLISTISFESLVFGINPRFHFGKFTVGISGGIKLPIFAIAMDSTINTKENTLRNNTEYYHMLQIWKAYTLPFIPYVKISTDYTIFSDRKIELTVGGYIGYDFGMIAVNNDFTEYYLRKDIDYHISSIDVGFQFGSRILSVK